MARRLETERDGRVLIVRIDNPRRNFMDRELVSELTELVQSVESTRSVGSLVVTGRPDELFITHYDVAEMLVSLARRAPISIAGAKRAVYEGTRQPLPEGLALERNWFLTALTRASARRALRRYLEQAHDRERSPWEDEVVRAAWREGTAVDLLSEDGE